MNPRGPIVAGHQPNFLPWFGYFEKMLKCDLFVYSDDVRYPKETYTNRVQMPMGGSVGYLTLPVRRGGDGRIADKRYVKDEATLKRLIKSLHFGLGGLPEYGDLEPVIARIQEAYWRFDTIAEFNIHMNQHLAATMGIATPVRRGTDLGLEAYHRNERLIQRCRLLGSRIYLSGQGADGYQDDSFLALSGIELRKIDYSIGRSLFGENVRFTVLHGIASRGLGPIRASVADYLHRGKGR